MIARDSFIDPDMQAQQSDLLYQVRLQGGQDAFVYLPAEHKSYVYSKVALQLLGYLVRIWEREVKNQRPLRPIVPIVI